MCLLAYELAAMLLPAALAFCRLRRRLGPEQPCPVLPVLVFAAYAAAVLHLTGAGTLGDGLTYQMQFGGEQVNLLPFSRQIDAVAYLQNVLLFVLFGLLLPWFWPALRRPKPVLFAGFGLSLVIELSQLLNNRRTDIDDLILNTLGAALGYALWRVMHLHAAPAGPRAGWAVPLGCLGAMCAGRLLLYHELWMASLLYGF